MRFGSNGNGWILDFYFNYVFGRLAVVGLSVYKSLENSSVIRNSFVKFLVEVENGRKRYFNNGSCLYHFVRIHRLGMVNLEQFTVHPRRIS